MIVAIASVWSLMFGWMRVIERASMMYAMFHMWCTIAFVIASSYTDGEHASTMFQSFARYTLGYYIVDVLIALCFFQKRWHIVIHHVFAIWMAWMALCEPLRSWRTYYYTIEWSNLALPYWHLHKNYREFNKVAIAWTYIPIRMFILPYCSYQLWQDTRYKSVQMCIGFIQLISWYWTYVVYQMTKLSEPQTRIGNIFYEGGQRYWSIVTYIVKMYVNGWLLYAYVPHHPRAAWINGMIAVDVFHVFASWLYNVDQTPWAHKLDRISIHAKIAINGMMAHYPKIFATNMVALFWIVWRALFADPMLAFSIHDYGFNFVLSSGAILYGFLNLQSTAAIACYGLGGWIWARRVLGQWSSGWMHVCVTLGDVLLWTTTIDRSLGVLGSGYVIGSGLQHWGGS